MTKTSVVRNSCHNANDIIDDRIALQEIILRSLDIHITLICETKLPINFPMDEPQIFGGTAVLVNSNIHHAVVDRHPYSQIASGFNDLRRTELSRDSHRGYIPKAVQTFGRD